MADHRDLLCALQLQRRLSVHPGRDGRRRGWCSGALILDIQGGNVDGTDVGGTKVAFVGDWPSGFLAGNGTGRIYFDPEVSQEQRSALESVLSGQQGGVFEILSSLIVDVLPTRETPIEI